MDARAIDWALLQSFLHVARAGSLSAAARASGVSQPTLGRHVRALQDHLRQPLLSRSPTGQALTPAGAALLAEAEAMEAAAARIALAAAGASARLEGTVRVTASRIIAHYHLPPILARLRREEPGIQIELVASDQPENLLFREADIALRMFRPDSGDLTVQKLADLPLGLYAACRYLDRSGRPETLDDLLKLDFVGYDRSELMLRAMARNGIEVTRDFFPLRCEDQLVHWALVRAGCGVGGMQVGIAESDPAVERIARFVELPPLPLWLAVPEALRHAPRIARVRQALAAGCARLAAA
ncbi:LysR family transcriptional regulator [Pararhodobacter sp. SW119]|uniref:LysR family transcriptional regulator n=1 Tax=Pararhodobacter sp. SW119 TaxID=2780075 RepID=UPI001AE0B15F|nr:LysR family transcriptional regulator [Pararhodobacter sp. SW119]